MSDALSRDDVRLTPRQVEFLTLASSGLNYKEIAEECNVSRSHVQNTLDFARRRLRAKNIAAAVSISLTLDILSAEPDEQLPVAA